MRVLYLLILLLLLGATTVFALQNQDVVTLHYLDRSVSCPLSVLVASVYFGGMLTGWTVIGLVRRSLHRVSETPPR
jgi:lipopolysaccharide assembly protein A